MCRSMICVLRCSVSESGVKAKIQFWNGKWWSKRMGVTGCGETPKAAYDDMWQLYSDFIKKSRALHPHMKVRA